MSFLNILLFGAPGSGKGTQSKILASQYNLFHLSTGDLLREAKNDPNSSFFKEINERMAKGELVSDEIIYNIVAEKITFIKNSDFKGIIFDGFPRNVAQAEFLEKELAKNNISEKKIFILEVSESVVIDRILNRFTCAKCGAVYNKVSKLPAQLNKCDVCGAENAFSDRIDDTPEIIKNRLHIFNQNMKPLMDFYKNINIIDASKDSEEIFQICKKILEK
jgi:adenylate kinase